MLLCPRTWELCKRNTYILTLFLQRTYVLSCPPSAPTSIKLALPPSYSIHLDTQATLPCEVEKDDASKVTFSWTKDGAALAIAGRLSFAEPGVSGSIVVSLAAESDAGVYMCVVNTTVGGLRGSVLSSSPSVVQITRESHSSEVSAVGTRSLCWKLHLLMVSEDRLFADALGGRGAIAGQYTGSRS